MVKLTMLPTKSMFDYISEINRLFPETGECGSPDLPSLFVHHPNLYHHSLTPQQAVIENQSSSSADSSLSPEYPDSFGRFCTPFSRQRRPIVGRKIIGNSEQNTQNQVESPNKPISSSFDSGFDSSPVKPRQVDDWTPKFEPNVYELFPERNRDYSFKTPMKTPLRSRGMSVSSNFSPPSPQYGHPPNRQLPSYPPPNFTTRSPQATSNFPSSSMQGSGTDMCTFCRKNGETPVVYMTHTVRTRVGNKSIVTCPILRSHICSTCGESGDNAHTITYCPVLRNNNNGLPLQSTTITLKNTRVKSNGRRRF